MYIYAIQDYQPIPTYHEAGQQLDCLGHIELGDHIHCQHIFDVAEKEGCLIHPFEDVYLTAAQVQRLVRIFDDFGRLPVYQRNAAYSNVYNVISHAAQRHVGLISFCA